MITEKHGFNRDGKFCVKRTDNVGGETIYTFDSEVEAEIFIEEDLGRWRKAHNYMTWDSRGFGNKTFGFLMNKNDCITWTRLWK